MTHTEKARWAVDDLVTLGIRRATAAPFPYPLLWRVGVPLRPPHYQGWLTLWLLNGSLIFLAFAVPLVVTILYGNGPRGLTYKLTHVLVNASAVFGFGCGLLLAAYYRVSARRLDLPAWHDLDLPPELTGDAEW